jgi:PRTRC genetic system ThiF family protein
MKPPKKKVHFIAPYLLNPTNPISINLIGAGGTGSQMLTALARMNYALTELGHAGFCVKVYDPDSVEQANLGRQLFSEHEIGMNKATAIVNRVNRFFGTNWKGCAQKFQTAADKLENKTANITLSCVDSVSARIAIAEVLIQISDLQSHRDHPLYWMDFGNDRDSGQVLIATLQEIPQPKSKLFKPLSILPEFISAFAELPQEEKLEPSCSLSQALGKQDLFINSCIAGHGASLLWSMLRTGMLENKGFYLNLKNFKTQSIPL